MMTLANLPVVLVMRSGLLIRYDHVDTMFRMGLVIHLLTEDKSAQEDPRYATVRLLDLGLSVDALTDGIITELHSRDAAFAVTFNEADIESVGRANMAHGVPWARPQADAIARDKTLQRKHLTASALPCPAYLTVSDRDVSVSALEPLGLPCIVKPSRGAGSVHVELVSDPIRIPFALDAIADLARSGILNFYDSMSEPWALIEEYLPGDEITCDGVVIDGRFHLGGVNTKILPHPPWFEEDMYVLPHGDLAVERTITAIMSDLARSLDLQVCLLNAEFRQDRDGNYRIVEFSTRPSGGHVYRNVRDVHAIDLVELLLLAAAGSGIEAAAKAAHRHQGRVATCIKFVYRTGEVVENWAGEAKYSPYFREYYATARRGDEVRSAPDGFDICGLLSVWGPYEPANHPAGIQRIAEDILGHLRLEVRPFTQC